MRGRREVFAWGESFMARVEKLKAPQIKKIERACRAYLKQIAAFDTVARDDPASSYVFTLNGNRYRLAYSDVAKAWVLEIVREAPKKPRNRRKAARSIGAAQVRMRRQAAPKKPRRKKSADAPNG